MYSDSLWAGRSGDRIPVQARYSVPNQSDPRPAQHTVQCVPGLFPGVKAKGAWS